MSNKFTRQVRQRIIDEYLAATGANMFEAGAFIDWLSGQPEHEAYPWFFSKTDAEAAREYRMTLARKMASGLRIVAKVSQVPTKGSDINVVVREFPAYVSPGENRGNGGGYVRFDPDDTAHMGELRRQGLGALHAWVRRYRGAFSDDEVGVIESLIADIEGGQADDAQAA